MKILLLRLRLIGDVVFTTPAIRAIRRALPDATLTYLVERAAAPVVAHNPHLDQLLVVEHRRGLDRVRDDLRLAVGLRRARYDVAVDFHGGPRTSWLARASGAPRRVGYDIPGRAWLYTDVVARPRANNYGPFQFPEKLIPLMILNALEGRNLPIYGDGLNVRDWLFVEDHCAGVALVLDRGRLGEKYNIGGSNERTNLEVVDTLCHELEQVAPAAHNAALRTRGFDSYLRLRTFVPDRPGHDRRYAIDASKISRELGWAPRHDVASGLARTVRWYAEHRAWCEAVQGGRYGRERLRLGSGSGGAARG